MSDPARVAVALGERSYDIVVGTDLLADAGRLIGPLIGHPAVVVVTDRNVAALYLDTLTGALDAARIGHREIVLDGGEQTKDFATLQRLIDGILDTRPERGSAVVPRLCPVQSSKSSSPPPSARFCTAD